jgi:hypothetical protein
MEKFLGSGGMARVSSQAEAKMLAFETFCASLKMSGGHFRQRTPVELRSEDYGGAYMTT